MNHPARALPVRLAPIDTTPPYGPPPPRGPADLLIGLFYQIGQLEAALPTTPLEPGQEQSLGGVLFTDGPGLVMGVGRGLRDHADRLADVIANTGEDGHSLLSGQQQASLWAVLEARLASLTRLARQTQLKLQADLIVRAMGVLKYVKATEEMPGVAAMPPRTAFARRLALIEAFLIVDNHYKSLHETRTRRQQARAAANPAAPAAPSERSLKAQARAQKTRAEQGQARLFREFRRFIEERGTAFEPPAALSVPPAAEKAKAPRDRPLPYTAQPDKYSPVAQQAGARSGSCPPEAGGGDTSKISPEPDRSPMSNTQEDRLKDEFAAGFQRSKNPPIHDRAFQLPKETLLSASDRLTALFARFPVVKIDKKDQESLRGRRHPLLPEIAESLATALSRHPAIAESLGFGAAFLRRTTELDQVATRQISVADLLMNGGENGALICGATADEICRHVLLAVEARIADPKTPEADRGHLRAAFSPALLGLAENDARVALRQKGQERAERPLKDQIDQAAEGAAINRLIDAFLTKVRGPSNT